MLCIYLLVNLEVPATPRKDSRFAGDQTENNAAHTRTFPLVCGVCENLIFLNNIDYLCGYASFLGDHARHICECVCRCFFLALTTAIWIGGDLPDYAAMRNQWPPVDHGFLARERRSMTLTVARSESPSNGPRAATR